MAWRHMSREEARDHKLYGINGWPLVIAIIYLLVAGYSLLSMAAPSFRELSGTKPIGDWPLIGQVLFFGGVGISFAFAISILMKSALAQPLSLALLLLGVAGIALERTGLYDANAVLDLARLTDEQKRALEAANTPLVKTISQSVSVALTALVAWYVNLRQRPNVTFRHRVKVEA